MCCRFFDFKCPLKHISFIFFQNAFFFHCVNDAFKFIFSDSNVAFFLFFLFCCQLLKSIKRNNNWIHHFHKKIDNSCKSYGGFFRVSLCKCLWQNFTSDQNNYRHNNGVQNVKQSSIIQKLR